MKRGLGAKPLTERQIRYANENTKSAAAAARFLNVSYPTYKKYAEIHGLFERQKNQAGVGISKAYNVKSGKYSLEDILEGKYPQYESWKLKRRLLNTGYMKDECELCGFDERRLTDYKVPILLDHIDGDKSNHKLENLRMLCYNCFFLNVGNIVGHKSQKKKEKKKKYDSFEEKEKEDKENAY